MTSSCSPALLIFSFILGLYRPLLFCASSNSASAQIYRQVSGLHNCLTLARLRLINCGNLLCSYFNSLRMMVALCNKCYVTRTPFGDSKLRLTCICKYPHCIVRVLMLGSLEPMTFTCSMICSQVTILGSMIDCAPPDR